ncbi:MAG: IS66 family transposase [Desulfovibrio sp.]|nr:IS66 family transposase [Desulfovibrio sp.]
MAEHRPTSTASASRLVSVREAIDTLNKWRVLPPHERLLAPCPDDALEAVLAYATHSLEKEAVNSRTSGVSPSQDQNRIRGSKKKAKGKRKSGGQPGHKGTTAEWSEHPDVRVECALDCSQLPAGHTYRAESPVLQQSVDVLFTKVVAEFVLERVSDENGRRYTASVDWSRARVLYMASGSAEPVPLSCAGSGLTAAVSCRGFSATLTVPFGRISYGLTIRAAAIEFVVMQMIPLARSSELFKRHFDLTLSQGFIVNACRRLAAFLRPAADELIRRMILKAPCAHFDETGISVNGRLHYIHVAAGDGWVFFYLSPHRGRKAMEEIGILPVFKRIAVHDCWGSYFAFHGCLHALCGAHLLRDLQGVVERDGMSWADAMKRLLLEAKEMKEVSPEQKLAPEQYLRVRRRYRALLSRAEKSCGMPRGTPGERQGRPRKRKGGARKASGRTMALIRRLRELEEEALRFLAEPIPFTNNLAELMLRMNKVKSKISGCFRNFDDGRDFCLIRSYLCTCTEHGLSVSEALMTALSGRLPKFMQVEGDLSELWSPPDSEEESSIASEAEEAA